MARDEGWLAEHMLILGVESPDWREDLCCRCLPQRLRQDQLRHAGPTRVLHDGWKVTTVGDDIAWIKPGADGKLYAINPESGLLRRRPRHLVQDQSERHGIDCARTTIFTNVALTADGDVWWEGMTEEAPAHLIDWTGKDWTPDCGRKAAHPNARFTCTSGQCPSIDPEWENPQGCADQAPSSSAVAAAASCRWSTRPSTGTTASISPPPWVPKRRQPPPAPLGKVRRDPFAMLPFCGYHMGDYFNHWLQFGRTIPKPPRIFSVNWFRKDDNGKFLWPGFGENMRVLKWIVERANGHAAAVESPSAGCRATKTSTGPALESFTRSKFYELMSIDRDEWMSEILSHEELFIKMYDRLPKEMLNIRELILSGLWRSPEHWEI